jgi:hypothetical protein
VFRAELRPNGYGCNMDEEAFPRVNRFVGRVNIEHKCSHLRRRTPFNSSGQAVPAAAFYRLHASMVIFFALMPNRAHRHSVTVFDFKKRHVSRAPECDQQFSPARARLQ